MIKTLARASVAAGVLAAAIFFLANGTLLSYTLLGHDLDLDVRDLRVYNNFADATANDNTTPDSDFGGLDGAELALCKGAMEWGSRFVGGSSWGDGGANFDVIYVGNTNIQGGYSGNIMSADPNNGGNVIAYCYSSSEGWKIRFYENWKWYDGPSDTPTSGSNMDLQGICAHEFGHAIGLDHTSSTSATMYAYASGAGNSQRTIETDDKNGVKAVYGTASSTKPVISSLSGGMNYGETLAIDGSYFSTSGNEVWFTGDGSSGAPVVVSGVSSYSSGTKIDVTIPSGARDGFVAVKKNATGHSALSNVYPLDIGGTGPSEDPVPDIKVNNSDTPPNVHVTETITAKIALEPNDWDGIQADWWVSVEKDGNVWWCQYNGGSPKWTKSSWPIRFANAPLQIVNGYVVMQPRSVPAGIYTFEFAIDAYDGAYQATYADTCTVLVYN